MRRLLLAGGLAVALALASCKSKQEIGGVQAPNEGGMATSLHLNALMDATFGSSQQKVEAQNVRWRANLMLPPLQPAQLPGAAATASAASAEDTASAPEDTASAPSLAAAVPQRTEVLVTPREVVRLNEDRAVLVFESALADAKGQPMMQPDRRVWLGAVFFDRQVLPRKSDQLERPTTEHWKVSQFQPYVDGIGFNGKAGSSEVFKLAPDHFLLTFSPSQCAGGVCGTWLSGYLLQPRGMALALQLHLAGNNRQQFRDCSARLDGRQAAAPHSAASREPLPVCYAITGEVHPISREVGDADLMVRYRGWLTPANGPRQKVQQSQIYRLRDGMYELLEGGPSPVPEGG